MRRCLLLLCLFFLHSTLQAQPLVRMAIVKTASVQVRQGLVFSGGDFGTVVDTHFSAFLIQHGDDLLLFDAGLGRGMDRQYEQDMPWWARPLFRYEGPVRPAADQLQAAGIGPVRRIVLSHGHWDHASGLEDFPGAEIWLSAEELGFVQQPVGGVGGAWPSQVAGKPLNWKALAFEPVDVEGFGRSLDLFGDGTMVLVPMYGHTPGSVGLLLRTSSGRRFFLVGDVVWNAGALPEGRPKIWAGRWLVDHDAALTQQMLDRIRAAQARDPALIVVPAHDGGVQDRLGLFPSWVD